VILRIAGTTDDAEEDLVLRLRDPRIFGEFAASMLRTRGIRPETRLALAEHAFDLLPLPRSEGDVFLVEDRAPPRLLELAAHLTDHQGLTVLHVMHLVYALFLDRRLPAKVGRATRSRVLREVLAHPETSPGLRGLYAALHLASIPEGEAASEFRWILRSPDVHPSTKTWLASAAADPEVSAARIALRARDEGLLPADLPEDDPRTMASIPRLPDRLRTLAARWRGRPSRGHSKERPQG
ncbi:MAG TPA: hypothetical protein VI999_05370, partial [Thermoplasmata archaeon]|nr:hypothetical protein [Thermoplasmata archaeon]